MRFFISLLLFVSSTSQEAQANVFESEAVRLEKAADKLKHTISKQERSKKSAEKLKQDLVVIQNNIERWRELSFLNEPRFMLVDIAGFQVFYYENGKQVFQTRALVGQKASPTPTFRTEIKEIVLNPWWVIPESIANNEILPLLKKDVHFLKEENLEVFKPTQKGLKKVTLLQADWGQNRKDSFPYIFKQRPGIHNPLGKIKFVSTNPNSIYLHGTSEPELFSANNRAVSHGCVRIEKPNVLALLLLKQTDIEWSYEKLFKMLQTGSEVKIVLKQKIPVYFGYWTAWADMNLDYHLREDIYKLDEDNDKGMRLATYPVTSNEM